MECVSSVCACAVFSSVPGVDGGVPPTPSAVPAAAPVDVAFGDISTAAYRIRSGVEVTPVRHSFKLSAMCGADITFKKDFLLPTGRCAAARAQRTSVSDLCICVTHSFKERGGLNALRLLDPKARARGVIAASAGEPLRWRLTAP